MKKTEWSNDALDDLEKQVVHIARDNQDAARKVAKRIRETVDSLGQFATGHPGRVSGTYEKSVTQLPYIIAYALSGDGSTVTILRVIHTSRNWTANQWPA